MEDYKPYVPKWDPIPAGGCCESAPQQACNTKADDPYAYAQQAKAYTGPASQQVQDAYSEERQADTQSAQGPLYYDLKLTQAEVLHLAQRVPSFRPLLESLAPEAFYEVVNAVDAIAENWQQDVRLSLDGAYEGLGLDLPVSYQWEIVPGSFGLGQALVGKRRIG